MHQPGLARRMTEFLPLYTATTDSSLRLQARPSGRLSKLGGRSAAPCSSPWGDSQRALSVWLARKEPCPCCSWNTLSSLCGWVMYPPHPFHTMVPVPFLPLEGRAVLPTLTLSAVSTVAVSLSPVGRVAPWGATRLEWCPHSTLFHLLGTVRQDLSAVLCEASLRAPPRLLL